MCSASTSVATGDARGVDAVDLRVEGTMLIVRASANVWAEQPTGAQGGLPVITVTTPSLRAATLIGGGRLAIDGPVRGQRIDLQLTGSGTMDVAGLEADQLFATVLGSGGPVEPH